jgi:hypothetical protein
MLLSSKMKCKSIINLTGVTLSIKASGKSSYDSIFVSSREIIVLVFYCHCNYHSLRGLNNTIIFGGTKTGTVPKSSLS